MAARAPPVATRPPNGGTPSTRRAPTPHVVELAVAEHLPRTRHREDELNVGVESLGHERAEVDRSYGGK